MADQTPTSDSKTAVAAKAKPQTSRGLRDLWQLPAVLAGVALVVMAIIALDRKAPGPDFEGVLADAQTLIERQSPAEALELLNGPILNSLGHESVTPEILGRYYSLRGDALFLGHRATRADVLAPAAKLNNERALAEYAKAEKLDASQITPRRQGYIAETTLDLGRVDEAINLAERLPDSESDRRRRLLKRTVVEGLAGTEGSQERARRVIEMLKKDPTLPESERVWLLSMQMQQKLASGEANQVIDELLPELQRFENPNADGAGMVYLLLGRAYMEAGRNELARGQMIRAEAALPPGDAARGLVETYLARLSQSQGELEEARDRFATAAERYPGTDAEVMALLGLGESEADLGRYAESLAAYQRLVDVMHQRMAHAIVGETVSPADAEASMEQRHRARLVNRDYRNALTYAQLSVQVYPSKDGQGAPAAAILRLAETHRMLAVNLLGQDEQDELSMRSRTGRLPREVIEEARLHYTSAGAAYRSHASAALVEKPEEAASSLWNAADCFDRAGDQEEAIQLFTEFAQNRRNDTRVLESNYRLARCFQAINKYDTAIALFEQIIRDNAGSDEALRSYVPLAQSYLLASSDTEFEKAERLLLQVLDGRMFQPTAPQFRRGLIELGQMYLRIGRFPEAITRLNEAIERYPDGNEAIRLRFDLADACRLSAAQIEAKLREAMPLSERGELEKLRMERLRQGLSLYEEVRASIDGLDPARLTEMQRVLLRNAVLYRGDCAFDLGDFELAIRHYDAAAQRYANEPASLVPMVQIVNCYAAQGRWAEARTAHERARGRLKDLPEGAWNGADIPMDRRHWERWLDSSLRLDQLGARAEAAE